MNESEHDNASDIPPALSAEEWKDFRVRRRGSRSQARGDIEISVSQYHDEPHALYIWDSEVDPGASAKIQDGNDVAAVIALANELLRRFDDPRAFLRQHVALLRAAADACSRDEFLFVQHLRRANALPETDREQSLGYELAALYDGFADALESMLPPETPNAS